MTEIHVIGEPIDASDVNGETRRYVEAVVGYGHTEFVETRHTSSAEYVIFDALAGVPSRSENGVLRAERIAIEIGPHPIPRVLALRVDFPPTPHQNLVGAGEPRWLCISAESSHDLVATLTPQNLLWRVTNWLERAARGELHLPGQPLEPFVFTSFKVIGAPELFELGEHETRVLRQLARGSDVLVLEAEDPNANQSYAEGAREYALLAVTAETTDDLLIHEIPTGLAGLAGLLSGIGVDLPSLLYERTRSFAADVTKKHLLAKEWLVLVRVPRNPEVVGITEEVLGFALIEATVGEVGVALGAIHDGGNEGYHVTISLAPLPSDQRQDVGKVVALDPVAKLTREAAQQMSGLTSGTDWGQQITAVGVGALGSEVVESLVRQGVGHWTLIDEDDLLPHNLARHNLPVLAQGHPKATTLEIVLADMLGEDDTLRGFREDVFALAPGSEAYDRLACSGLILDISTSRAVLRHLAALPVGGVRVAAFISASRKHLVVLSEGDGRRCRVDDLDAQLASACGTNVEMGDVFIAPDAVAVRYGGGCSDLSAVLSDDVVTAFASAAVGQVKRCVAGEPAFARVWERDEVTFALTYRDITISEVSTHAVGTWTVRVADSAVAKMSVIRASHLPCETGGVLVGSFDVGSRILYVTDVLEGPADSEEWPNLYRRGSKGLAVEIAQIATRSGGEIGYVGEWHSHPDGSGATLSATDDAALAALVGRMREDGLPALVVVVAAAGEYSLGFAT